MYSSILLPGEQIINDSTPFHQCIHPDLKGRGYYPSERLLQGYKGIASAFPDELMIPESEWQERIKEKDERKTKLSDWALEFNLPCKDQERTNYCWINAPTHCLEIVRLLQNQQMIIFSPASAGAVIKNFQNVGGWGGEGLEFLIKNGSVPIQYWPANAIDRRYYTEENKKIALKYRVQEWIEIVPRNMNQLVSCLLRNIPVAVGLNWWSHEVTYYDVVWLDGTIAIRFRNSWGMSYGSNGFNILQGSKMYADDAVSPLSVMAA